MQTKCYNDPIFCKEVKKDFTVCLSGECADEIFAGYPWYHKKEILFENVFPWARNTNIRQRILKNGFLSDGEEYLQSAYKNTLKNISYLGWVTIYSLIHLLLYKLDDSILSENEPEPIYESIEEVEDNIKELPVEKANYTENIPLENENVSTRE